MQLLFVITIFVLLWREISTKNPTCLLGVTVGQNKKYISCMGVPYAKPPVGHLRFKPPVKIPDFNMSQDYTDAKAECYGLNKRGSEDCLYLDIYVPMHDKTEQKSILAWIPGDNFNTLSMDPFVLGPDYLLDEDIIFIVVKYRTGFFGFASTYDMEAPGNYGLKDIEAALSWIQGNIELFGGNPRNVTIMGHGSSAALVSILQVSLRNEHLFSAVIMQSGTALAPWTRSLLADEVVLKVAKELKTKISGYANAVEGLRAYRDGSKLQHAALKVYDILEKKINPFWGSIMAPVAESNATQKGMLTEKMHQSLKQGKFKRVPTMIGYSKPEYPPKISKFAKTMAVADFYPISLGRTGFGDKQQIGQLIKSYYSSRGKPHMEQYNEDVCYLNPLLETVQLLQEYTTVYLYQFNQKLKVRGYKGNSFGYEMAFLFNQYEKFPIVPANDSTRIRMVKFVTNFVKHGNPTPFSNSHPDDHMWYPVDHLKKSMIYMLIYENGCRLQLNPDDRSLRMFQGIYQNYSPKLDTF